MNYFEIRNADDILTINDSESCMYLKYRINLKGLPLHDRMKESLTDYLYKGDGIAYIKYPKPVYIRRPYIYRFGEESQMSITHMLYLVALLSGMQCLPRFAIKGIRIESATGQITYK